MQFELELVDGDKREIEIPDKLPYRLGKKLKRKVRSKLLMDRNQQMTHTIDDPAGLFADLQDVVVQELVPADLREFITDETASNLLLYYNDDLQGGKVKKNALSSETLSKPKDESTTP